LASAGDDGLVRLFNSPCVVDEAPCREYRGHSSHVMKARFVSDPPVGHSKGHSNSNINSNSNSTGTSRGLSKRKQQQKKKVKRSALVTVGGYDSSVLQWRLLEEI
jgi:hypothetical protein